MPSCVSCGKYTKYNNGRCLACFRKAKKNTFTTETCKYPRDKKTGEYMHRKSLEKKIGKAIPKGYEVKENKKTGLPYLKKKK